MYSGSFFECQDNAMPNRWYTAYTGGAKDNVQAVSDHTSTPVYLSHHLQTHNYTRDLQSSATPLLSLPQSSLTDSQLHTRPSVICHSTAESTSVITYRLTATHETFSHLTLHCWVYLSHHLQTHSYTRDLQSSDTPLLSLPCYMTCTSCQWSHLNTSLPQSSLTDSQLHTRPSVIWHSTAESTLLHDCFWWPWFLPFNNSTSCVWNSLPRTVLDSQSLSVVKTKLKTHLFHLVHNNGE